MNERTPKRSGISRDRWIELRALCRQYDELRQKRAACYDIGRTILSDRPRGGAKTSAVERKAERAAKYGRKIEAIEKAARQASGGSDQLAVCLLENVTHGTPYERMQCPCGRRQFYELRAVLFCILDELLG